MKLSNENQFLLYCARFHSVDQIDNKLRQLINLNWQEIIIKGKLHRILPLIYYHLKRLDKNDIPNKELKYLKQNYQNILMRNRIYFKELRKLIYCFKEERIKVVLLKGGFLSEYVYKDIGLRPFSDIDILIERKSMKKAKNIMGKLGFVEGKFNKIEKKIEEFSKSQKIINERYTGHLEFVKYDNKMSNGLITIEIHSNIFWNDEERHFVGNIASVWRNLILLRNGKGKGLYRLSNEYFLLHSCFHLFKDATSIGKIAESRDLRLLNFTDIYEIIMHFNSKLDWKEFKKIVNDNNLETPVYYSLYYANMLFDCVPNQFLDAIKPSDTSILNRYGYWGSEYSSLKGIWKSSFYERLFDVKRKEELFGIAEKKQELVDLKMNKLKRNICAMYDRC